MKRVGYLYKEICDKENCKAAILEASANKRNRKNVQRVLADIEKKAEELSELLRSHSYVPAAYSVRYINDGVKMKRRRLAKPRFWPDQCVHHALDRVMSRVIMRGMDYYCCGSVKGRGIARAKKGIIRFIKRHPKKAKYCFKMDIHKYYDSISHEEMMRAIRRKVKDPEVLWLYQTILDSYDAVDPERSTEEHEIFRKGYGIPIGIDPSRWLCNLFLEHMDHEIRGFLGKDYFSTRYVDDIVIIGPNKRKLHHLKDALSDFLGSIQLKIKKSWQIFRISARPIDFLGFKFHRDGHVEMRKSVMKRIKRKITKVHKMPKVSMRNASGMISYMGYVKGSNSQYFFTRYIKGVVNIKRLRRIVSHEGKIRNKAGADLVRAA